MSRNMKRDGSYGLEDLKPVLSYHSVHSVINKFPKTDK